MSHQVTSHRLASGFENGLTLANKTGTVPTVRNEAGVATYPDGKQYIVSVFTRADSLENRQPAIDAAIGQLRTHRG